MSLSVFMLPRAAAGSSTRARAPDERISLFEQPRSDCVMVAVGFSPRDNGRERLRVAERRLNRRANRTLQASLRDARSSRSLTVG